MIDDKMACEDLTIADLDGDKQARHHRRRSGDTYVKIYWNETPTACFTIPARNSAIIEPAGPKLAKSEGIPEGLWMRCPECGDMLFRKVVEEALHVCPELPAPLPHQRPHAHRAARRPRQLRGDVRRHRAGRSAEVRRQEGLQGPPARRADEDRQHRRRRLRQGVHQRPADHDGGDGPDIHDGLDGQRGRRKDHAHDRSGGRGKTAAADRQLLRRGAHAGVHAVADADGQDQRGISETTAPRGVRPAPPRLRRSPVRRGTAATRRRSSRLPPEPGEVRFELFRVDRAGPRHDEDERREEREENRSRAQGREAQSRARSRH